MSEPQLKHLPVGTGDDQRALAAFVRGGRAPGIFWLGGFRSDMKGTKAEALDLWADEHGRAAVRFDYSGHGGSGGSFEDGTISRWLDEAEAVFDAFTAEPQVLVGSSMGGCCSRRRST
jgi:pimeloyl-ACP methyl ester carboxylesterase